MAEVAAEENNGFGGNDASQDPEDDMTVEIGEIGKNTIDDEVGQKPHDGVKKLGAKNEAEAETVGLFAAKSAEGVMVKNRKSGWHEL